MTRQTLHHRVIELERQLGEAKDMIQTLTSKRNEEVHRHYELLFAYSRDIILILQREDGRILDANAAAIQAYGYNREELLELTIYDLRAPVTQEYIADQMAAADRENLLFETIHVRKDGSTFPVEVNSQGVDNNDQRILISIIRDVTRRKQAEEERERLLRAVEQEKREAQRSTIELEAVIDAMHDPVMVYNQDGLVLRANASAVRAHGFDPSSHHRHETNQTLVVRYPDGRIANSDDLPSARALKGETVISERVELINRLGQELTVLVSSSPLVMNGVQMGVVSVWHDISEQEHAEQARRESETLLTKAFQSSPDALVISRAADGRIVEVNESFERLFDFSRQEVIGKTSLELALLEPLDRQVAMERMRQLGFVRDFEIVIRTRNGERRSVYLSAEKIIIQNEEHLLTVLHDLTERKQLEEAVHREHVRAEWLARLPGENPNPVVRVSADGIILYHNPAAAKLPEWRCADGRSLPDPLLSIVAQAMERGEEVQQDVQLGDKTYSVSVMPVREEAYANVYGRDISDRKQAEKALEEARRRIDDILRSLGDGLFALDREWSIIYINDQATKIAGIPSDALIGENIWDLWPALLGTSVEGSYRQAMEDRIPAYFRVQGIYTNRWYDVSVYPSSEGITIYYVDKTEQIQAEQSLRESEEKYRTFFNHLYETVSILEAVRDEQGEIVDWIYIDVNQETLQILDVPLDQVVGKSVSQVLGVEALNRYMGEYRQVLETGEPISRETVFQGRDFLVSISRMDNERIASIGLNISERKRAEKAQAEFSRALERSNRELEQFAFVASHDLQEPLRKIEAFGDSLLENTAQLDEHGRSYIERMMNAARRMRGMVDGLLRLSRVTTQGQPFQPVDLAQTAGEVLSDLEQQVQRTGGRVEIGELPVIEGDPLQISQLLQNLIGNALKYHLPHVPPVVKVHANTQPDRVKILVEDNGIGFPQGEVERIFQPFQRLVGRSQYEGSGLGLAICQKIVERHGGEITAKSEPGKGATFVISLPVRTEIFGITEV